MDPILSSADIVIHPIGALKGASEHFSLIFKNDSSLKLINN